MNPPIRVPRPEDFSHRLRVPRPENFSHRLRGPGLTARVGLWLGVCFLLAFVTGVYSHLAQDAPGWFPAITRPVWLYRVTQGVHVASGAAAVPLLLVKLWSVYPRLFERPPVSDWARLAKHGAERVSIAVLVAGSIFQLATGLANSAQWYPWGFSFRATHYAVGWITIGALLVHARGGEAAVDRVRAPFAAGRCRRRPEHRRRRREPRRCRPEPRRRRPRTPAPPPRTPASSPRPPSPSPDPPGTVV